MIDPPHDPTNPEHNRIVEHYRRELGDIDAALALSPLVLSSHAPSSRAGQITDLILLRGWARRQYVAELKEIDAALAELPIHCLLPPTQLRYDPASLRASKRAPRILDVIRENNTLREQLATLRPGDDHYHCPS